MMLDHSDDQISVTRLVKRKLRFVDSILYDNQYIDIVRSHRALLSMPSSVPNFLLSYSCRTKMMSYKKKIFTPNTGGY